MASQMTAGTIDLRYQQLTFRILDEMIEQLDTAYRAHTDVDGWSGSREAAILVVDIKGRILGYAQTPSLDGDPDIQRLPPRHAIVATSAPIAPGTMLWPLLISGAIENHLIEIDSEIPSPMELFIGRKIINGFPVSGASLSPHSVLREQSNTSVVALIQDFGWSAATQFLTELGFNEQGGLELAPDSVTKPRWDRPMSERERRRYALPSLSLGLDFHCNLVSLTQAYLYLISGKSAHLHWHPSNLKPQMVGASLSNKTVEFGRALRIGRPYEGFHSEWRSGLDAAGVDHRMIGGHSGTNYFGITAHDTCLTFGPPDDPQLLCVTFARRPPGLEYSSSGGALPVALASARLLSEAMSMR